MAGDAPVDRPARPSTRWRSGRAAPAGYLEGHHATGRATIWAPAAEWAERTLADSTLYSWAHAQADRGEFQGRGTVYTVPAPVPGPDARGRWAVRHYLRGGAMAMPMEDRYLRLGRSRPRRELAASACARERGIATPAVIAGATYVSGFQYTCDLVTEVVPGVRPLADVLHARDGTRGWLIAMARAGDLVRQLASVGVFHVDLNSWNVLMDDDEQGPVWVVDLDRARIHRRASASLAERMLGRLARSIVKIGTPTGERLTHAEVQSALETRMAVR